jgi:cytochrome c oxidase subunit 2
MKHLTLSPKRLAVMAAALLAIGGLVAAEPASASPFWWVTPVTPYGQKVDFLYQLMMWICIAILAVVEVLLVVALVKFRKKEGDTRQPETWNHNTKLEVIWTAIPFALLIVILVPTFQALAYLADVPKNADLTLEVVGHQFFWEYRYPELGVKFNSSPRIGDAPQEPLYIPTDRKLKVVLTSSDVIHSWWIPAFGMQQMTTPGNLSMVPLEIKTPGTYEGACAFLCGPLHGAMNVVVKAVPGPEFDAWAAKNKGQAIEPIGKVGKVGMVAPPPKPHEGGEGATTEKPSGAVDVAALKTEGSGIYTSKCAGCHGAAGAGVPGMFPPLAGSEQVNGDDKALIGILLNGLSGPVTVKGASYNGMMPPWKDQLNDKEIAAVATFVRSSWGNNGKVITPDQVESER